MQSVTTEPRSPRRRALSRIPFEPSSGSFAIRTQLAQELQQIALVSAAWQRVQKIHMSIWLIRSRTLCCVVLSSCSINDKAFTAILFYLFTNNFIDIRVFACGVQRVSNRTPICSNVDEPFHLLANQANSFCCHCHDAVRMRQEHKGIRKALREYVLRPAL